MTTPEQRPSSQRTPAKSTQAPWAPPPQSAAHRGARPHAAGVGSVSTLKIAAALTALATLSTLMAGCGPELNSEAELMADAPEGAAAEALASRRDALTRVGAAAGGAAGAGTVEADPGAADPRRPPGAPARPPSTPEEGLALETIAAGTGWRTVMASGAMSDSESGVMRTATRQQLVIVETAEGLEAAPLGATVKGQLRAELAARRAAGESEELLWVVDSQSAADVEAAATRPPRPRAEGAVLARGEGVEGSTPHADGFAARAASCPDYDKTLSKTLSKSIDKTAELRDPRLVGTLSAGVSVSAGITGTLVVRVKRFNALFGCVPYAVGFRKISLAGHAAVVGDVTLNAKSTWPAGTTFRKSDTIGKLHLGSFTFAVGPVPVVLGFNMPLEVGLDATGSIDAEVAVRLSANAGFELACTKAGCSATRSGSHGLESLRQGSARLFAQATVTPWVRASIRGYLYDDRIVYAQVGVRESLPGTLWAYQGATCGDGDGDGVNEFVSGATLSAKAASFSVGGAVGLLGKTVWATEWPVFANEVNVFWDLVPGGSSALKPILIQQPVRQDVVLRPLVEVTGRMRPCWPYADQVTFKLDWKDGTTSELSAAPATPWTQRHTYRYGGRNTVTLTAVRDSSPRTIGATTARVLAVPGVGPVLAER